MCQTPIYTLALIGICHSREVFATNHEDDTLCVFRSSSGHLRDHNFMGIIDLVIFDQFQTETVDCQYPVPRPADTIILTNRYAFPSSFRIAINKILSELQLPYSGYDYLPETYRPKRTRELFRTSNPQMYRSLLVDLAERIRNLEATKAAFDDLFRNHNMQFTETFAQQIRYTVETFGNKLRLPYEEMRALDIAITRALTSSSPSERWMSTVRLVMPIDKLVERHRKAFRDDIQNELAEFQLEANEWLSSDEEKTDEDWKRMRREQDQWRMEEEEELKQDRHWDYLDPRQMDGGIIPDGRLTVEDQQTQHLLPWIANLILLNGVATVFKRYLNPEDRNDAGRYPAISRLILNELSKTRGRYEWVVGIKMPYTSISKFPY